MENLVAPAAKRLGTMAGASLAVLGASAEVVHAATLVTVFLVGLGVDLVSSRVTRKKRDLRIATDVFRASTDHSVR